MVNMEAILQLSAEERIKLIDEIWESLDSNQIEITQNQKSELDHRILKEERGETQYHGWDSVKAELPK